MSQAQLLPTATVAIVNGSPCVSSVDVASHFGKPHDKVLRSIREIMAACPENLRNANFGATFRYVPGPNGSKRKSPAYNLTRDAFSLVVMGFTGKEALAWKIRYIEAFNAMEAALKERAAKPAVKRGRPRKALTETVIPAPVDAEKTLKLLHSTRERCRFEYLPKAYSSLDRVGAQCAHLATDLYKLQDCLWAALYNVCAAAEKVAKWS